MKGTTKHTWRDEERVEGRKESPRAIQRADDYRFRHGTARSRTVTGHGHVGGQPAATGAYNIG